MHSPGASDSAEHAGAGQRERASLPLMLPGRGKPQQKVAVNLVSQQCLTSRRSVDIERLKTNNSLLGWVCFLVYQLF